MSPVEGVSGVSGVSPLSGVLAAGRSAGAADVSPAGDASGFAGAMVRHLDGVQAMQADADTLAVQAATGDLQDVHDYTIAATQARIATELTVAVRNKAVEAFSEIMRMQA